MFETGKDPYIIAKEEKMLILEINTEVTFTAINEILNEKKDLVDKYLNGKTNLFGYFMGESLNKLKGKDTTENIKKTLENLLNKNSKK